MADITLGDLITLIFREITDTLEETSDRGAEPLKLQVSDVDIEIPAHLRLQTDPQSLPEKSTRVIVTMPSARETGPVGSNGRIRITITTDTELHSKRVDWLDREIGR
ncbi:MAG: hypothetical protein F6J90_35230 [Moorea sp. SIOASIH]|uniref:hypothetical protein n=1 Tax=Moorena sp. SIOASIH TaxID=2607817 RepID=UPI0013B8207D|nr:hypothetical protein [Moorena sp. SIOASIH]NEO41299.1 hypothetical protein [Moorena sp. SIOASIH]